MTGQLIRMRPVEASDASFILSLRTDENKNKYLSPVVNDLNRQVEWIENYKVREARGEEYYFIIEGLDRIAVGCVRMYDFRQESFSWGSWILTGAAPTGAAVESALLIYDFAFQKLGFKRSHFEVRKGNASVSRFHKAMGAKSVRADDIQEFFTIDRDAYDATRKRYLAFVERCRER